MKKTKEQKQVSNCIIYCKRRNGWWRVILETVSETTKDRSIESKSYRDLKSAVDDVLSDLA